MATLEHQLKERLKLLERITQEENKQKELSGQTLSNARQEAAVHAEKLKDLTQLHSALQGEIAHQDAALDRIIGRLTNRINKEKDVTGSMASQKRLLQEIKNATGSVREELAQQIRQLMSIEEHHQRSLGLAQQYQSSWAQALGFSTQGYENLIGNIVRGTQETGNFTQSLMAQAHALADAGADIWTPMNVLNTILENTRDFAIALDASTSEFVSATGASRDYGEQIQAVALDTTAFGADVRMVGQAYAGLYNSFTSFSQLSKEQQMMLGRTGSLLQKVGVDARMFGEALDSLTKGLQMSLGQAETVIRSFSEQAAQLGIAPATLTNNFVQLMPQLAAFGAKAPAVFLRAASAAKSLGLEMQQMLNITNKFDEFDRAAESVGGLNAILGGTYLDTVSMVMTTDPTERIIMLKQAFDAAGQSVQQMEYYQLKALATQAGFGENIDAFRRAMSSSTTEIRRQSVEQQRLQELAASATNVMDKLRNMFYMFMVQIEPVIDMVRMLMDSFMAMTKNPIIGFMIEMIGKFGIFVGMTAAIVGAFQSVGVAMAYLATTSKTVFGQFALFLSVATAIHSVLSGLEGVFGNVIKGLVAFAGATILASAVATMGTSLLAHAYAVTGAAMMVGSLAAMIPHYAEGGEMTEGIGLVGEKGPELIVAPKGSNVINNENSQALVEAADRRKTVESNGSSTLAAALAENTAAMKAMAMSPRGGGASRGSQPERPIEVTVMLDGNKVGRSVVHGYMSREADLA